MFNFTTVYNKVDSKWYIWYLSRRDKYNQQRQGYLPLSFEDLSMTLNHSPPYINTFIIHHLNEQVHLLTIQKVGITNIWQSYQLTSHLLVP